MKNLRWKVVVLLLLAIPIVNFVGGRIGQRAAEVVNAREAAVVRSAPAHASIRTVSSSQDAEGVTQEQMSIEFLRNFENYTVERAKVKAKEYLASIGRPNDQVSLSSEATYVQSGAVKLAVLRISDPASRQVLIAGIVGRELRRVVCVRESVADIPISYGACAEKVKEVFGVTIGG